MGQKVNPHGLRIGINKDWDSKWFASKKDFARNLHIDIKIREYIINTYSRALLIDRVLIERLKDNLKLYIYTAKPAALIGPQGANSKKLIVELQKVLQDRHAKITIDAREIKKPELNAQLIANDIAIQLENRASFRITQKLAIRKAMRAGAKGIKTLISGRLGGAEMARSEGYSEGTVPLHTLRQNIHYATANAHTTYGIVGIKVWLSEGEILNKDRVFGGSK